MAILTGVAEPSVGRRIGVVGTAARVVVGGLLVGSVVYGHVTGGFHVAPWLLGLVGFPGVLVGWQRWRARRPDGLRATGPVAHV